MQSKTKRHTFPGRRLFAEEELAAVQAVFSHAWETGRDFGYQGPFEEAYTDAFSAFQGGGYADGVCSGTVAVFLCLLFCDLPRGSEVIVSPVTDPGGIAPILYAGLTPVIADSAPNQFNTNAEQISRKVTPKTKAILLTHTGGLPCEMDPIVDLAQEHGLMLIEDCSQAHGATYKGKRVGTFGHLAAFSTMFSKQHASGGSGGLVYMQEDIGFDRLLALADRGKDPELIQIHPKDPDYFRFPALNFNMDELSAAIGHSTLKKLPTTLRRREEIVQSLVIPEPLRALEPPTAAEPSYFFLTIDAQNHNKQEVVAHLKERGIPHNPDYRYVASEWSWLQPFLPTECETPNACAFRDNSFNLLFHEAFTAEDVAAISEALAEVY